MSGLRNADGAIVIDEAEAEEDIRFIEAAKSKLEEAKQILAPSNIDSERMYGSARDALEEQLEKINRALSEWEDNCDSSVRYIRHVVAEYKRIDREFAAKLKGMS